jgi:hypothetical protein
MGLESNVLEVTIFIQIRINKQSNIKTPLKQKKRTTIKEKNGA